MSRNALSTCAIAAFVGSRASNAAAVDSLDRCRQPLNQPSPHAVFVAFPAGNLLVKCVESEQEPTLDVSMPSTSMSVQAQQVFLGDGKRAIRVQACSGGVIIGNRVTHQLRLDDGATLEGSVDTVSIWGAQAGVIYLRIPNLRLIPRD